jgi:vacuolar-type H+-ATPase subunit F/Vma7
MPAPVYLGDEISAAGFRLAGVETFVPAAGTETAVFTDACARAPLVLVCASVASRVGEALLRARVIACSPPIAVIPDLVGDVPVDDIAARLRRQLGVEA